MLKSLLVLKSKPFHRVFIHGLGLDARGRAMHRTQGNVIDPWPLIKQHGADAIRLFVAGETNPGDDFRISEAKIGGGAERLTQRSERAALRLLVAASRGGKPPDL